MGGGEPGFIYKLGLRRLIKVWGRGGSGGVAPIKGAGARGKFSCLPITKCVGLLLSMRFVAVHYFLYSGYFLFSAPCRPLYKGQHRSYIPEVARHYLLLLYLRFIKFKYRAGRR